MRFYPTAFMTYMSMGYSIALIPVNDNVENEENAKQKNILSSKWRNGSPKRFGSPS